MSDCWIPTASGRRVDLLDPQPEMFCIEDIVGSLVKLCRFTGQCSRFYSVAEHSWIGSQQMPMNYSNLMLSPRRDLQVEFQLHDAAEAYLGDVSSPLKSVLPQYKIIEFLMDRAIRKRFGLPVECSPEVHAMDLRMLATERRDLLPAAGGEPWPHLAGVEPLTYRIRERVPMHPDWISNQMLSSLRRWVATDRQAIS